MQAGPVVVISASVGAGHDAAAAELVRALRAAGVPAIRRDYLQALPGPLRWMLRRGYPLAVGYAPGFFQWLFHGVDGTGWVHKVVLWVCRAAQRRVLTWVADAPVVVSTYMLASQTLGQLKQRQRLRAPVVTFVPDPAVHRLWIHPRNEHHCSITSTGSDTARHRFGVAVAPVHPLVHPAFSRPVPPGRRSGLRTEWGIPPDAPVALVAAGSLGLGDVPGTVAAIQKAGMEWVVVLCGRNQRLRHRLRTRAGVIALGWRDDIAEIMAAVDVLVHNAGGVSLSEALVAGLPAVTYQPLPGHGRANAAVLERAGLAPWPTELPALATALHQQAHHADECGHHDRTAAADVPRRDTAGWVATLARHPQPDQVAGSVDGTPREPDHGDGHGHRTNQLPDHGQPRGRHHLREPDHADHHGHEGIHNCQER